MPYASSVRGLNLHYFVCDQQIHISYWHAPKNVAKTRFISVSFGLVNRIELLLNYIRMPPGKCKTCVKTKGRSLVALSDIAPKTPTHPKLSNKCLNSYFAVAQNSWNKTSWNVSGQIKKVTRHEAYLSWTCNVETASGIHCIVCI